MGFAGQNLLSISQLARADVELLFRIADEMRPYASRQKTTRVLEGAVLANLFFEPSTRTRLSFGSAFNRLGGAVQETTDVARSSLSKGESLSDMGRVVSGYSDILVVRHPEEAALRELASASRVPVINGGNGAGEHPSQALLDLYTMDREVKARRAPREPLDGLRIALVGDLKHSRTIHSLCMALQLFSDLKCHLVAPPGLELPGKYASILESAGGQTWQTSDLAEGISSVDVIYATRIQEERFSSPEEANHYRGSMRLSRAIYRASCEPGTLIMHPLPRDHRPEAGELNTDLDGLPELAIFRQSDNGIPIRMAMFALILDVTGQL